MKSRVVRIVQPTLGTSSRSCPKAQLHAQGRAFKTTICVQAERAAAGGSADGRQPALAVGRHRPEAPPVPAQRGPPQRHVPAAQRGQPHLRAAARLRLCAFPGEHLLCHSRSAVSATTSQIVRLSDCPLSARMASSREYEYQDRDRHGAMHCGMVLVQVCHVCVLAHSEEEVDQ